MITQTLFEQYLEKFKEIILLDNPSKELKSLYDKSNTDLNLNSRQRDVIMSRCKNFLDGNWEKSIR
jgi:hypothetical protein